MKRTYQYRVVKLRNPEQDEVLLNELGEQGFRLVAVKTTEFVGSYAYLLREPEPPS